MEENSTKNSGESLYNRRAGHLDNSSQIVRFSGHDEEHTEELRCSDVTLVASGGKHDRCSPMVNLKTRVDYSWEQRYNTGQLLAIHIDGKYLAYGLRAGSSNYGGSVRVVSKDNNNKTLIKGMTGAIEDLSFAHIPSEVLLAVVDELANLFVYKITEINNKLEHDLIMQVKHDVKSERAGCNHRVVWVPYMPDETDVETKTYGQNARLLVLTINNRAELWQVGTVVQHYGMGPHNPDDVDDGMLVIEEHTKPIIDATFSPEGTALATVSLDGSIKFFQVYMQQKQTPRCLHNWIPHDGKQLSSVFFLDNHKYHDPDSQFWKFVITGAVNNTELKVWSCVDWTCLQTIRFTKRDSQSNDIALKAGLDLTSRYLVLSDVNNKLVYLLRINFDDKETKVFVSSASEFLLPFCIISFGLIDAFTRQMKTNSFGLDNDEDEIDEDNDEDEEDCNLEETVTILMYIIQPKSMQECCIKFTPPEHGNELRLSTILSSDSMDKTELKSPTPDDDNQGIQCFEIVNNPYKPGGLSLNLMTPQEFSTSPAKKEEQEDNAIKKEDPVSDGYTTFNRDVLISGGSSPSREVQEILSLKSSSQSINLNSLMLGASAAAAAAAAAGHLQKRGYFQDNEVGQLVDISDEASGSKSDKDKKTSLSNGWPHIPLPPEVLNPTEDAQALGNRLSLEQSDGLNENISETPPWKLLQKLDITMSTMLATVQEQQAQIMELMQEVNMLRSRQPDGVLLSMFEKALERNVSLIRDEFVNRDMKERERQENLLSAVSQAVGNIFTSKLDDIVTNEIKDNILPVIFNEVETLKQALHIEMAQKLSATDHLLKENISKLVHSKSMMDTIATTVSSTVRPCVNDACRDAFSSVVVPRCEKALDNMFQQCHNGFSKGTHEYYQQLHKELDKLKNQVKKSADNLTQVEVLQQESKEKFFSSFQQEFQAQFKTGYHSLHETLNKTIRDAVTENINKEFRTQKAILEDSVLSAVRSRAVTPASHVVDQIQYSQQQILSLINSGQINSAFQQALSASDLNIVMFTCEKLDPHSLFRQDPCPLQQPVLLSLIQQLSADMCNNTELKLKYIEEAIMNLDRTNSMTKEHLPGVMNNLQKQLNLYINNYPASKYSRQARILLMMAPSVLLSSN